MRLSATDEQLAFEDGLRRALANLAQTPITVQWQTLANLGVAGLGIPETFGGTGGGSDEIAIAARLLGEAGLHTPFAGSVAYSGTVLLALDDPGHAATLEGIAGGALTVAPITESEGALITARRNSEGYYLSGHAPLVRDGGHAQAWLIEARDEQGRSLLLWVPRDTPGIAVQTAQIVDGTTATDLDFSNTAIAHSAVLAEGAPAESAIAAGNALQSVVQLWSAAAGIEQLVRLTRDHVSTREQFGQPLAAFQIIQHRVARMHVLAAEARSAAAYAQADHAAPARFRDRALSSAFVRIAEIAEQVSREAVQLHGAMGFTEECGVSGYFKMLFAFIHSGRSLSWHKQRLAAILRQPGEAGRSLARAPTSLPASEGISLALSHEDEDFRRGVCAFLDSAVDDNVRRGARLAVGVFPEPDVASPWHRKLFAQGWIAPYLQPEAGGTGWSPLQAYLFEQECARAGAPSLQLQGLRMLAPVLLHYGTREQIERYLPGILSGNDLWCQGYSEPGAGSDLAALRTRAVGDADGYVINGTKIWTTQAQHATHMFALVRTSTEGRRQEGISFLLIDMRTPGITVRPIRTLAGELEFNEVFFDNVRVPRTNLLGEENRGWECAKYLLDFERGGSTVSGPLRAYLARALRHVDHDDLDERIASTGAALDALEMGELVAIAQSGKSQSGHVEASALKLRMAEIRQQIGAIAADALGRNALRWPEARPLHHQTAQDAEMEDRLAIVPNHFNDLAYSIFAGSSEIQLSIIAAAIGLKGGRK